MGSRPVRVVYIAGYGRSGSTLVDLLLGQHPDVVSGGELIHAPAALGDPDARCSCDRPLGDCPRWAPVRAAWLRVLTELGWSVDQAAALHRRAEGLGRGLGWTLHAGRPPGAGYRRLQVALFTELAAAGNGTMVVDSSKTAGWALGRLAALTQLPDVDLRVLHLVRDPEGVRRSAAKGRNRDLERGHPHPDAVRTARALLGWSRANALTELASGRLGRERVSLVRYEDLLAEPEATVARLAAFLELDCAPLSPALTGTALAPAHLFSGNRMRLGPVRLDPSHAAADTTRRRSTRLLTGALAQRYGY